eukprot:9602407-Karenia_brevis.AAC.1
MNWNKIHVSDRMIGMVKTCHGKNLRISRRIDAQKLIGIKMGQKIRKNVGNRRPDNWTGTAVMVKLIHCPRASKDTPAL